MKRSPSGSVIVASVVTALLTVVAVGCNSTGCIDNQSALPLAGFYDYATLSTKVIYNVSIGAIGAPNDSLLLDSSSSAQTLYMPFNLESDETAFVVRYHISGLDNPAMYDTLRFTYNRVPFFASDDCGVMYKYDVTDLTTTHHHIDSVAMPYTAITQVDVESIQIFFGDLTPITTDDDTTTTDDSNIDTDNNGNEG